MKKKPITLFASPEEYADFLRIQAYFERKTESDTLRAMLSFCKKNLIMQVGTATHDLPLQHIGNRPVNPR